MDLEPKKTEKSIVNETVEIDKTFIVSIFCLATRLMKNYKGDLHRNHRHQNSHSGIVFFYDDPALDYHHPSSMFTISSEALGTPAAGP